MVVLQTMLNARVSCPV